MEEGLCVTARNLRKLWGLIRWDDSAQLQLKVKAKVYVCFTLNRGWVSTNRVACGELDVSGRGVGGG